MRALRALFALSCGFSLLFNFSCNTPPDDDDAGTSPTEVPVPEIDQDEDGYNSVDAGGDDCNDADPEINPGAEETCDHVDNDCDDEIDEGVGQTWYSDADQDTYGDQLISTETCDANPPEGYVADDTDCDDGDPEVNPGAVEVCDSGDIDEDCDDLVDDEDPDVTGSSTWYADSDGDTYGDPESGTEACDLSPGFVSNSSDCDDTDAGVSPSGLEACNEKDDDCDGEVDEGQLVTLHQDSDGDSFGDLEGESSEGCPGSPGYASDASDCDDGDAAVNPAALEICNETDDDCDGETDEDVTTEWYPDQDDDGYGAAVSPEETCAAPNGFVIDNTDCDDADVDVNPGADEVAYNGKDDDCDSATADNDLDGDGHDHAEHGGDDCDDTDPATYPGAVEKCDAQDNDCDGEADEGLDADCLAQDADQDGYSVINGDCDDENAQVNPDAEETCDRVDNDCNGDVDDGLETTVYYLDADGDGYGTSSTSTEACAQPSGYVADSTDCDDEDGQVHPDATEICDGTDNDCEGGLDEGVKITYYRDKDGDGYGANDETSEACSASPGYVPLAGDCDDYRATVNPDATETCNGRDDDCDDETDEALTTTYYTDGDGDGYGTGDPQALCTDPGGVSTESGDCDDTRTDVYPGHPELCDEVDNDCDGSIDDGVETWTFFLDGDGDGYGVDAATTEGCALPDGYSVWGGDCEDADPEVHPDASEECDSKDNDCNEEVDETCWDVGEWDEGRWADE